jgi:capsular polysaccharide biosynthesis protein
VNNYLPVDEPLGGPDAEPQPVRRELGQFVSLHYVGKALSRRRWIWISMAIAGLLVGMSLHVIVPRKFQAESTLYMYHNPNDDPSHDMANDVALLESNAVAQLVVDEKGLKLGVPAQKFATQYLGVAVTDNVLQITVNAPTAAEAVARDTAIDNQFLKFRASILQSQNTGTNNDLQTEINNYMSVVAGLQKADAAPNVSSATLASNQAEIGNLQNLAQILGTAQQNGDVTTQSEVAQSKVVSAATAITHSALKIFLADSGSGLIGGLAIGLGLIVVLSVVSDRIRLRSEFAAALDAPVELSVGRFRRLRVFQKQRLRRKLGRPGRPVELMARYLRGVVHTGATPKRLAIVSVESLEPSALSLAILAGRLAVFEGKRVMVTDMSPGRILGELLGVSKPETRIVFVKGAWVPVLVSVPPEDDPTVEMPPPELDAEALPGQQWSSPHVVLVLATVDPATGASHLTQMADEAIVVATAGRSNATEIRSTSELIRSAGLKVRSAILVGTDRNDDTLGLVGGSDETGPLPDDFDQLIGTDFISAGATERG